VENRSLLTKTKSSLETWYNRTFGLFTVQSDLKSARVRSRTFFKVRVRSESGPKFFQKSESDGLRLWRTFGNSSFKWRAILYHM